MGAAALLHVVQRQQTCAGRCCWPTDPAVGLPASRQARVPDPYDVGLSGRVHCLGASDVSARLMSGCVQRLGASHVCVLVHEE